VNERVTEEEPFASETDRVPELVFEPFSALALCPVLEGDVDNEGVTKLVTVTGTDGEATLLPE
jgi:hypothetical protein